MIAPGSLLGGYRIQGLLGKGGMGSVFLALDRQGGEVALKVLSGELCRDPRSIERFLREARAVAALAHPNITSLRDEGRDGETRFLVFERLPGGTLRDRLRLGRLPWREAAEIGAKVASALAAVHAAGLVHRDVKPGNVLLGENGEPKLSDFGLVRGALAEGGSLTATGELVGTLEFMAPEQANAQGVSAATDLYGLGATLHALVAGSLPFQGTGYALVKKHLLEKPRPLRELVPEAPARLEALVLRLLAKDPGKRGEAREVAHELEAIARSDEASELSGRRPPGETSREPGAFTKRAVLAAGALLLAAIGVVAGFALQGGGEAAPSTPPSPVKTSKPAPAVSARSLAERAIASTRKGDFPQAIADAGKAVELDPKLALAWLARAEARHLRCEDMLCQDREENLAPLADLDQAIAIDARLARAHAIRAEVVAGYRPDEALASLTRAFELDPDLAVAHRARGILASRSDLAAAVAELTRALDLDAADVLAWIVRANLREQQHDVAGASADCERALELRPRSLSAVLTRARFRLQAHDFPGAIADFSRAIEIEPARASSWFNRGYVKRQAGDDWAGAAADFDRAIALDSRGYEVFAYRAECRAKLHDLDGALADFEKAIAMAPEDTGLLASRGSLYLANGMTGEAIRDFERYLALTPDGAHAPLIRARLAELKPR